MNNENNTVHSGDTRTVGLHACKPDFTGRVRNTFLKCILFGGKGRDLGAKTQIWRQLLMLLCMS